jgi:hypothetical protein
MASLVGFGFISGIIIVELEGDRFFMSKTTERLEQLQKQEAQLKTRIQREKAKISDSSRKERTGKLVAWGVVDRR